MNQERIAVDKLREEMEDMRRRGAEWATVAPAADGQPLSSSVPVRGVTDVARVASILDSVQRHIELLVRQRAEDVQATNEALQKIEVRTGHDKISLLETELLKLRETSLRDLPRVATETENAREELQSTAKAVLNNQKQIDSELEQLQDSTKRQLAQLKSASDKLRETIDDLQAGAMRKLRTARMHEM